MDFLIVFLWFIFFIYLFYFLYSLFSYKLLLNRLKKIDFPYTDFLNSIPEYHKLSKDLQLKIKYSILLFMKTKQFVGVGVEVDDKKMVQISFFACLLVLNKNQCYDNLKYIYLYPVSLLKERVEKEGGVFIKKNFLIAGEKINESVILGWDENNGQIYMIKNRINSLTILKREIKEEKYKKLIDRFQQLGEYKLKEWIDLLEIDTKLLFSEKEIEDYYQQPYLLSEITIIYIELFFRDSKFLKQNFPTIFKKLSKVFNVKM